MMNRQEDLYTLSYKRTVLVGLLIEANQEGDKQEERHLQKRIDSLTTKIEEMSKKSRMR